MGRIVGERIVLREYRWEDLEDIRAWVTDAGTTRYVGGAFHKPQTVQQTEEYLRNMLEGGSGANFIIAEREHLSYLGQCNIMMVDNTARMAELAFVIRREYTGQGYGYEAGRLLINFAFQQMNLNRVSLHVHADNLRAIRLYEKLGLRHEGCLREAVYRDGQYVDKLVMGLLRREWRPVAQQPIVG